MRNATSGTYIQNGSSSGNGFGANLVEITSGADGTTNDRTIEEIFHSSTSTINHNVQVGDELTVIYTSGNGVDAHRSSRSERSQFIVNT